MHPLGLPRAFAAVAPLTLALGVGTVALTASSGLDARQATVVAFALAVAWGYAGAGLWMLHRGRATRVGLLTVALGCALFISCWIFSDAPLTYTIGLTFGLLWLALLPHLVLAFPSGRLRRPVERWLVGWGYAAALLLQPLPWLFWVGDYEPVCDDCPPNLVLLEPNRELAQTLLNLYAAAALAGGAVTLAYFIRARWWRAGPREKRALTPIVVVGGALLAFLAAGGAAQASGHSAAAQGLAFGYFTALGAMPFAMLAAMLRGRTYRAETVSGLVERLGATIGPDGLRDALSHALGDPTLEVAYWAPDRGSYVDGAGRALHPTSSTEARVWTEIEHEGRPLAAIIHDAALNQEPGLVPATGAAVTLGLERERLAAVLRSTVQELRASRARIVRAGDDARRGIERDLHDGAQQRLVSLLLDLKLARRDMGSDEAASLLDAVEHDLADALEELRALASGILPPALTDHGLEAAVEELTGRLAIDVRIETMPAARLPHAIEVAAYFVIAEALTNVVKHARAGAATVRVTAVDGRVRVEIEDDGIGGASQRGGSGLRGLADRVEALGGRLTVNSRPGCGTTITADLTCAS